MLLGRDADPGLPGASGRRLRDTGLSLLRRGWYAGGNMDKGRRRILQVVLAMLLLFAASPGADAAPDTQQPQPPTITKPPSKDGWARARHCPEGICDLEGSALPDAVVHVYLNLADALPIIGQPLGEQIGLARTGADGRWEVQGVDLRAGENVLTAVADMDGVRSDPSPRLHIAYHRSDAYGGLFQDTIIDTPTGEALDLIAEVDTRESVRDVAERLNRSGYVSAYWLNEPADTAEWFLHVDTVFFFSGHGANSSVWFESGGQASNLEASDVLDENLSAMRLAVLVGCGTGRDTSAPDSIVRAFYDQGADAIIGFKHTIYNNPGNYWSDLFWLYVTQQMEVHDAATQAALYTQTRYWLPGFETPDFWLSEGPIVQPLGPDSLAILSRGDVYVAPAPGSTGRHTERTAPDSPGLIRRAAAAIGGWFTDMGKHIQAWLDDIRSDWGQNIRAWWEEQRSRFEGGLSSWWERQKDALERGFLQELERRVNELCGGSASIGFAVGAAAFIGRRRNASRRK